MKVYLVDKKFTHVHISLGHRQRNDLFDVTFQRLIKSNEPKNKSRKWLIKSNGTSQRRICRLTQFCCMNFLLV